MGKKYWKNRRRPNLPQTHQTPQVPQILQPLQQIITETQTVAAQIQLLHTGPLPHPSILQGYDQVVPGSAERIIFMAEQQAKHRQGLEKAVIDSDIKDSKMGLWFGFIISTVAIISGAVCIVYGHAVAGGVIGGPAVPSLTAVFVYGSRQRKKEREAKIQQVEKKEKN